MARGSKHAPILITCIALSINIVIVGFFVPTGGCGLAPLAPFYAAVVVGLGLTVAFVILRDHDIGATKNSRASEMSRIFLPGRVPQRLFRVSGRELLHPRYPLPSSVFPQADAAAGLVQSSFLVIRLLSIVFECSGVTGEFGM